MAIRERLIRLRPLVDAGTAMAMCNVTADDLDMLSEIEALLIPEKAEDGTGDAHGTPETGIDQ